MIFLYKSDWFPQSSSKIKTHWLNATIKICSETELNWSEQFLNQQPTDSLNQEWFLHKLNWISEQFSKKQPTDSAYQKWFIHKPGWIPQGFLSQQLKKIEVKTSKNFFRHEMQINNNNNKNYKGPTYDFLAHVKALKESLNNFFKLMSWPSFQKTCK